MGQAGAVPKATRGRRGNIANALGYIGSRLLEEMGSGVGTYGGVENCPAGRWGTERPNLMGRVSPRRPNRTLYVSAFRSGSTLGTLDARACPRKVRDETSRP